MILSMAEILNDAKKRKYGVAAPNVFSNITVKACFEAAEEMHAPIILDCAGMPFLEETAEIARFYERKYPNVYAALNLDHGGPYEEIVSAIRFGFSSVMIDRSMVPYEEDDTRSCGDCKNCTCSWCVSRSRIGTCGSGI